MANFNGTLGADSFGGTSGINSYRFTSNELQAVDVIQAGAGIDSLELVGNTAATAVHLILASAFTNVFSIEVLRVLDNVASANITVSNALVSRSGWNAVAGQDYAMEFFLGAGAAQIDFTDVRARYAVYVDAEGGDDEIHGGRNGGFYIGGDGIDRFFAGQGVEIFEGGKEFNPTGPDADFVQGTALAVDGDSYYARSRNNLSDTDGNESIEVTTGGTFSFFSTGFEWIFLANAASAATITLGDYVFDVLIEGGSQDDTITVNVDANFAADPQALVINGNGGSDHLYGSSEADSVNGGTGVDYVYGGDGNDTLNGGRDGDILDGGAGDDTIDGGAGDDLMSGGSGEDVYLNVGAGDLILEGNDPGNITDTVKTALVTYTLAANVEVLHYTGGQAVTLTGNNSYNTIYAARGADLLTGLDGWDTIYGAAGNDSIHGDAGNDRLYGEEDSDNLFGGADDDFLYGGRGADSLFGGNGRDLLYGGKGSDLLNGGGGTNDAVYYTGDTIGLDIDLNRALEVLQGADIDTLVGIEEIWGSDTSDRFVEVGTSITITFHGGAGYDTADYGSVTDDILFFNALEVEEIRTGSGNDALKGFASMDAGAGDDLMYDADIFAMQYFYGRSGSDTVDYSQPSTNPVPPSLRVNLADDSQNAGRAAGDRLVSIENLIGNDASDDEFFGDDADNLLVGLGGTDGLFGGNGNDTLYGGAAQDFLDGGEGDDTIRPGADVADLCDGGTGRDTLDYSDSAGAVTLYASSDALGILVILHGGDAEGDEVQGFENLTGSSGNDFLYGDSLANTILGNAGSDVLEGGDGADVLDGGTGTDQDTASYVSCDRAVTVNLMTGVNSGGDAAGDTLIDIENLTGGQRNDTITGNDIDNVIEGGRGGDTMDGGLGEDTLSYAGADAWIDVDLRDGTSSRGHGNGDVFSNFENLLGSAFGDRLIGDTASNTIWGGAGDDTITGGVGADRLYGGEGADTFKYALETHSTEGTTTRDLIYDFDRTEGDRIDLSSIDAIAGGDDDAFFFTGNDGADLFSGQAGELRWFMSGGNLSVTHIQVDTDGDAIEDMRISVTDNLSINVGAITLADLIL